LLSIFSMGWAKEQVGIRRKNNKVLIPQNWAKDQLEQH